MDIFWRLLFAHLVSDFTLQTDSLVKWKRENKYGVIIHCIIFMTLSYVVCWDILSYKWMVCGRLPIYGWLAIVIITAAHYAIDRYKVDLMNLKETGDSLTAFLTDQFLHLIFIALFFVPEQAFKIAQYKWWILGIMFVLVTHFMSILIYYLQLQFFQKRQLMLERKYVMIADRLVVSICFLINSWLFVLVLIVWISRTFILMLRKKVDYSWFEVITGYLGSLVIGMLSRIVYFS